MEIDALKEQDSKKMSNRIDPLKRDEVKIVLLIK
jgi:hypothetical protein